MSSRTRSALSALPASELSSLQLEMRDLTAGYDGIPVLHGVSFSLPHNNFGVVLGSNGEAALNGMIVAASVFHDYSVALPGFYQQRIDVRPGLAVDRQLSLERLDQ